MFMPRLQYFPIPQLFNLNILEFDNGRIEAPRPKLFSSNHCIWRYDTRRELGTAPYIIFGFYTDRAIEITTITQQEVRNRIKVNKLT